MAKMTVFALADPAAVIRLMWERCPDTLPPAEARARELRRGVEIVRSRLSTLSLDETTGPRWGAMTAEDIVAWQDFLLASGAIRRRLAPETYFNASLVERLPRMGPADELIFVEGHSTDATFDTIAEQIAAHPEWKIDHLRPSFLLVSAAR